MTTGPETAIDWQVISLKKEERFIHIAMYDRLKLNMLLKWHRESRYPAINARVQVF